MIQASESRCATGWNSKRNRLDQLLEQMRRTVQDAEESEPLLAKELYDAVRKANEQKIPDALKVSRATRGSRGR